MLTLALATEPGPFFEGAIRIGHFLGFGWDDGRLIAMAGEACEARRLCRDQRQLTVGVSRWGVSESARSRASPATRRLDHRVHAFSAR